MKTFAACSLTAIIVIMAVFSVGIDTSNNHVVDFKGMPRRVVEFIQPDSAEVTVRDDRSAYISTARMPVIPVSIANGLNTDLTGEPTSIESIEVRVVCNFKRRCDAEDFGRALAQIGGAHDLNANPVEKSLQMVSDEPDGKKIKPEAAHTNAIAPPVVEKIETVH